MYDALATRYSKDGLFLICYFYALGYAASRREGDSREESQPIFLRVADYPLGAK